VGLDPDQSLSLGVAEAVQEVAFVLDQVSVTDWRKVTVFDDAEIVTVGCGFVPPPPLLLPPQVLKRRHNTQTRNTTRKSFVMMPPQQGATGVAQRPQFRWPLLK
jgi:hypothetical protein